MTYYTTITVSKEVHQCLMYLKETENAKSFDWVLRKYLGMLDNTDDKNEKET